MATIFDEILLDINYSADGAMGDPGVTTAIVRSGQGGSSANRNVNREDYVSRYEIDYLELEPDRRKFLRRFAILRECMARGLKLITKLRRNMKNRFVSMDEKLLLRKRSIIETINDQLKNISQIEHTRHRGLWNFLGNLASGLIAYCWKEKKPSLNLKFNNLASFIG